jgi:hypothetical protein
MEQRQESTNTTNKTSDIFDFCSNVAAAAAPLSRLFLSYVRKKYENKYHNTRKNTQKNEKQKGPRGPPEAAGATKEPTKRKEVKKRFGG